MFSFKVSINDEDYLRFNRHHFLNSVSGKKSLMYFRFFIPFIALLMFAVTAVVGSKPHLLVGQAIAVAILSVLWFVYAKKSMLRSLRKQIEKAKKNGRLPYSPESEVQFDEDRIRETTPETKEERAYTLIEKIDATEYAIYVYSSVTQAYIVPITVFESETEKQNFLDFLQLKTGKMPKAFDE